MTEQLAKLTANSIHFTIDVNGHAVEYSTVERYISNLRIADDEWSSLYARDRCIATGQLVEVQWYPRTPVGFCIIYGPTLEEVLTAVMKEIGS